MRVEFNGKRFSADMDSNSSAKKSVEVEIDTAKVLFKGSNTLICGIISLAISLCNLPFGLFMNISTEILSQYLDTGLPHWVFVLFALSSTTLALSGISGIFAIVNFAKSEKHMSDWAGFSLSILSFILICLCFILNIVGLFAW